MQRNLYNNEGHVCKDAVVQMFILMIVYIAHAAITALVDDPMDRALPVHNAACNFDPIIIQQCYI